MNITKRQPVSVGEMINKEFLVPMELTQGQLAEAMGVSRKTVNDYAPTAAPLLQTQH